MHRQATPAHGVSAFLATSAAYLGLDVAGCAAASPREGRERAPRRLTSTTHLGYPARERYIATERNVV